MSKSHSSSTQQSQTTQALDPQVKGAILDNYANIGSIVPQTYTPYSGDKVAPFNPSELQGFGLVGNIANNQTGAPALQQAETITSGIAGYTPQQITSPTATATTVDGSLVPTVTSAGLPSVDLSGYIDPYVQNVVDTSAKQIDLQRQRDLNSSQQNATLAGAWRGDRQGVADALTNESANNTLAQTVATLYGNAYNTAAQNAEADLARNVTAQQSNQATQAGIATTNAQLGTQTNLANAASSLAAQQSNQSAEATAKQLGLSAATSLAGMSQQDLDQSLSRAQALISTGQLQQQQVQATLDWAYQNNYLNPQQYAYAYQQLKDQALGLAGDPTLTQSNSTGKSSQSGFSLFGGGGGGSGLSSIISGGGS